MRNPQTITLYHKSQSIVKSNIIFKENGDVLFSPTATTSSTYSDTMISISQLLYSSHESGFRLLFCFDLLSVLVLLPFVATRSVCHEDHTPTSLIVEEMSVCENAA